MFNNKLISDSPIIYQTFCVIDLFNQSLSFKRDGWWKSVFLYWEYRLFREMGGEEEEMLWLFPGCFFGSAGRMPGRSSQHQWVVLRPLLLIQQTIPLSSFSVCDWPDLWRGNLTLFFTKKSGNWLPWMQLEKAATRDHEEQEKNLWPKPSWMKWAWSAPIYRWLLFRF